MEAGRELDALIAEKVMGWTPCPCTNDACDFWHTPDFVYDARLPHYSSDIAAAWQIMERLWQDLTVSVQSGPHAGSVRVTVADIFSEDAPTAPLAICLAALKALGDARNGSR